MVGAALLFVIGIAMHIMALTFAMCAGMLLEERKVRAGGVGTLIALIFMFGAVAVMSQVEW